MLLGTLGTSLLGNLLIGRGINKKGKGAIATSQRRGIVRAGEEAKTSKRQGKGIVRAGYGNKNNNKVNF